MADPPARIKK